MLVYEWLGMNTDLQYAAVFGPAAGFQARRQLVVTDGGWIVVDGGFQKRFLILLKKLSDEVHST